MTPDGADRWTADGIEVVLTERQAVDGSWVVVLEASGVDLVEEVCLLDHRIDVPDGNRDFPAYLDSNRFLSNLPGTTILFPVVDLSRQTGQPGRGHAGRQLEIEFLDPGVEAHAFTFG
jgi:hypothetical protein